LYNGHSLLQPGQIPELSGLIGPAAVGRPFEDYLLVCCQQVAVFPQFCFGVTVGISQPAGIPMVRSWKFDPLVKVRSIDKEAVVDANPDSSINTNIWEGRDCKVGRLSKDFSFVAFHGVKGFISNSWHNSGPTERHCAAFDPRDIYTS